MIGEPVDHQWQRKNRTGKMRQITRRNKPFIGWDGEGYNRPDGTHVYALFGSSTGLRATGDLNWRHCLDLLFRAEAKAHHVIYAGTYDVVQMFKNEPREWVSRLLHGKIVFADQYRIQYLRGKMLRVTDRERQETRILYDVFTFFGGSFVKACREYLGDSDELTQIETMKLRRNEFVSDDITGSVDRYMGQELAMLVELMNSLRDRLASMDVHPSMWHGPGAVASTVLRKYKVAERKGDYSDEFRRCAEAAYYGGRFEQFQRGTYEGKVYQYDIRSAYPSAMRRLIALDGVEWKHANVQIGESEGISPHDLYHVSKQFVDSGIGYVPHRNRAGSIYYPQFVRGWYWGFELPQQFATHIDQVWYMGGLTPRHVTDPYPFKFVQALYDDRAQMKRDGNPAQIAAKLILNSLYGKMAQSKGAKHDERSNTWAYPRFHEVVWAGQITAITRRMISDALHSVDPSSIIATETDSVFSLEPLPVDVGPGLGQWDCEELEGIAYIQSGVSLVKKGGEWSFKTRGFTMRRHQDEVSIWRDFLAMDEPALTVKQTRYGTDPRQVTFGKWYDQLHTLSLDRSDVEKRIHRWCEVCETGLRYDKVLHRLSVPPIPKLESTPYKFVWNADPTWLDANDVLDDSLGSDEPLLRMEYVT